MRLTPSCTGLTVLAAALLALAISTWPRGPDNYPVPDLVEVSGGSFMAGNFQVMTLSANGEASWQWAAQADQTVLPPYPVEVRPFTMMRTKANNALYVRFLKQTKHPALAYTTEQDAQAAAKMTFSDAQDFCSWLGQYYGLEMRLPTEAEWEYAARGGAKALIDSNSSLTTTVPISTARSDTHIASPNPLGLEDMTTGLHEWVIADPTRDPENVRIFKGGNHLAAHNDHSRLPIRGLSRPLSAAQIKAQPELAYLLNQPQNKVYLAGATARCVAPIKSLPITTAIRQAEPYTDPAEAHPQEPADLLPEPDKQIGQRKEVSTEDHSGPTISMQLESPKRSDTY